MRAVGRHPSVSCWIKASNSPGPGAGIGTSTTDVLLWSDNMFRLLGLEPGEITPTPEYVLGRIHPEDRERVERELEAARAVGTLPDVTYRITLPDGSERSVRSFAAVAE